MGLLGAATKMIGPAFTLYQGASDYTEQRREGTGKLSSAMYAGGNMLAWAYAPHLMLASQVITGIPQAAWSAYNFQRDFRRNLGQEQQNKPFATANFMDTQQNYTMRQAGMAIAQQSNYATQRAMLGNEARFMAR